MLTLATLVVKEGVEGVLRTGLSIARAIGLPVSSWQPGDPSRALFKLEAEKLGGPLEDTVIGFIKSGFLDYAEGVWLKVQAKQGFGVDVPDPTYASGSLVLTNSGGGVFEDLQPGDITFRNVVTGKTYRNTTGGDLLAGPGTTLMVSFEADEPGSASSAAAGEVAEIVTTMIGVTCTNPIAAIGTDEQPREETIRQCRAKQDARSPMGPKGAYTSVAVDSKRTGRSDVTRARSFGRSDIGETTLYLAGPSGAVSEPARQAVEDAILRWSTPLTITPIVLSAESVVIPVSYELWVYADSNKSADELEDDVESALEQMMAARDIGGDIIPPASGAIYKTLIESTIRGVNPAAFRVAVSVPASDTPIAQHQVPALGAVTAMIHLVER